MSGNDQIVVIGRDKVRVSEISNSFASAGYKVRSLYNDSLDSIWHPAGPEIVVVCDDRGLSRSADIVSSLRKRLELGSTTILELVEGGADTGVTQSSDAEGPAVVVCVNRRQLLARVEATMRLSTMQRELRRRIRTAQEFGIVDREGDSPASESQRVLIYDSDRTISGGAPEWLPPNTECDIVIDGLTCERQLAASRYDTVVVVVSRDDAEKWANVIADIRSNPRLFTVPVVFVRGAPEAAKSDALFECGADDVVDLSSGSDTVLRHIDLYLSQSRLRGHLIRGIRHQHLPLIVDNLTHLYGHGFFCAHLARQIAESRESGRVLTVGMLEIEDLGQINRDLGYAVGDHLLRQMGTVLGSLLRGEDLAGRYSGAKFGVSLPDTSVERARVPLQRIRSIVNNTEFSIPGIDRPLHASVSLGIAPLDPARDLPLTLLERARRARR